MIPRPGCMTAVHTRARENTARPPNPRSQVLRPVPDHPGVSVREIPSVKVGTIGAAAARSTPPLDFHGVSVLWIHLRTCISILDIFLISLPLHGYPGHLGHVRSFPFLGIYRAWTPQSPPLQTFGNLLRLVTCQRRKPKFVFVQGRIHILPDSRDILLVRLDRWPDTPAAKKTRFNARTGLVDQPLNAIMNRTTLGESTCYADSTV
jgi:hypothetical protein